MAVILHSSGQLYRPLAYEREDAFEASVLQLADQIFGPSTIYIPVKRRMKGNDIVTIPDGYLLDMTQPDSPQLFVIENEIVGHDPFRHIGIQMLKFVTSFEDAKTTIRNFLMDEIAKDSNRLNRLTEGSKLSNSRNIDNYLDRAVYGDFRGLVVIDEARHELHQVLEKINANISVLELKTFEAEDGTRLHQFDTLYPEYDENDEYLDQTELDSRLPRQETTAEERALHRARLAEADTIIVPARKEGFRNVFLAENQWYAIRIGAAMKERIKYIAAYQVAPISAVTHLAEIQDVRPYKDTGKYVVIFKGPAQEIGAVKVKQSKHSPQGPVYVKKEDLVKASSLEEALL